MKITSIKQQVKRPDRYSIYVDGSFSFGLSEAALLSSGLASGQELDAKQLAALKDTAAQDKVYGNALRYVAMRPRSEWELLTYMQRKKVDEPQAEQVMQRLRDLDLLNDRAFAESWVNSRRLLKATSKRKLQQELQQKRVSQQIIESVLQADAADERTVLLELITKKHARYPDRAKFMQYLARQGFGYEDIKAALSTFESEN